MEVGGRVDTIKTIGQNTEKSPGDLRRVAVTQTPVKDHQLKLMWKARKGVNNNNNNNNNKKKKKKKKKKKNVAQKKKASRKQALLQKTQQSNKHLGCSSCKILGTIIEIDKERT